MATKPDTIKEIPINQVKPNPNNPRIIKDDKFKQLVKSIQEFPEMLQIRPIVCNSDMIVLGGNMRLKACKEAGLKKVPVIIADQLSEAQQREFIIKDNVAGGEWDWDMLQADFPEAADWGVDLPEWGEGEESEEEENEEKEEPRQPFGDNRDELNEIDLLKTYKKVFVNFSGGKDSIACACYLKKNNIPFELVCCQEIYQHPDLPEYVNYVANKLQVKLNLLDSFKEDEKIEKLKKWGFPSRANKWCNSLTKVKPLNDFYKKIDGKYIRCIGTRAEEGARRAKMTRKGTWGNSDFCFPIFDFKINDVIEIIKEFDIKLHHCYISVDRMGCFVCPEMSSKKIKQLMVNDPYLYQLSIKYYLTGLECEKYRNGFGMQQAEVFANAFDEEYTTTGLITKEEAWFNNGIQQG